MYLKVSYDSDFDDLICHLRAKYPKKLFDLDGIGNQLDMAKFSKEFFKSSATVDSSIDPNANVDSASVISYEVEAGKPLLKINSYYTIWKQLKAAYGLDFANTVIEMNISGDIYIHDLHGVGSGKYYCYNYSAYDVMTKGLPMVSKIKCDPPEYLYSFKSQLEQFVNIASNSSLGATGFADLFIVMAYYVKNIIDNLEDAHFQFRDEESAWTYVRETITSFIYTINQPSRSGLQCVTDDTQVLTLKGWQSYNEVEEGQEIYTWQDGKLNIQEIQRVNVGKYTGEMHEYIGSEQIVTPNHKVLHRHLGKYQLDDSADLVGQEVSIPVLIPTGKDSYRTSLKRSIESGTFDLKTFSKDGQHVFGVIGGMRIKDDEIIKNSPEVITCEINTIEVEDQTIWCPTTEDGVVIYRRNGSVFISGNSPYVNVSIYDDAFIDNLAKDYLFPDGTYPDKDIIKRLQVMFTEIMNETLRKTPATFPVTSACLAVDDDYNILDPEFKKFVAKESVEYGFMNIYTGKSSTVASCCFDGNQEVEVLLDDRPTITTFLELSKRDDESFLVMREPGIFKRATLVKLETGNHSMYEIQTEDNKTAIATDDHKWPLRDGSVRFTDDLKIGDEILSDAGASKIKRFRKYPYVHPYVYCFEMQDKEDPFFMLANGLETHNCRLRSDMVDNGYMNSIGGGATKLGSVGVVTLNLPRLALQSESEEDFFEKLKFLVVVSNRINNAKRKLIKTRIDNGNHPLYDFGFVTLDTQYSTTGINGLNEALEYLGYDVLTEEGQQFTLDIMDAINTENKRQEKLFGYMTNCEQVPAENTAVKLASKDTLLKIQDDHILYSNQFIPLITKADVLDRIRLNGKFDKVFSGGSICHINLDEKVSAEIFEELIDLAAKLGVIYWAPNYNLQKCEDFHMTVGKKEVCSICGKDIVDNYMKVVGFLTSIKNWHKVRRELDYPNRQIYKASDVNDGFRKVDEIFE